MSQPDPVNPDESDWRAMLESQKPLARALSGLRPNAPFVVSAPDATHVYYSFVHAEPWEAAEEDAYVRVIRALKRLRHGERHGDPHVAEELGELRNELRALQQRVEVLEERDPSRADHCAAVARLVRDGAAAISGVTSAYISPSGCEFVLVGPVWTPELSEAGAELGMAIQEAIAPDRDPYIEGGFEDTKRPPVGWKLVYP